MVLLDGISVSHRQTFLWMREINGVCWCKSEGRNPPPKKNKIQKMPDELQIPTCCHWTVQLWRWGWRMWWRQNRRRFWSDTASSVSGNKTCYISSESQFKFVHLCHVRGDKKRWPHQVGLRVGWGLVDLPQTEEALSISNSTLPGETRGISTTAQVVTTGPVRVCVCACVFAPYCPGSWNKDGWLWRCRPVWSKWAAEVSSIQTSWRCRPEPPSYLMYVHRHSNINSHADRKGKEHERQQPECLCIRNRLWTTAEAFKLTLTILVDGMRCHSFHIIEIPFHNLEKKKKFIFFPMIHRTDRCNMTDLSQNLNISLLIDVCSLVEFKNKCHISDECF